MRWLALLAVLLWAMVPAGVMPAPTAEGGVAFALCSGSGPLRIAIGTDGWPQPVAPMAGHEKQPCPYASAVHHLAEGLGAPHAAPQMLAFSPVVPVLAPLMAPAQPVFLRPMPRAPPHSPDSV